MSKKLNALVDDCVGANRDTIANAIQSAYGLGYLNDEMSIVDDVKREINKLEEVLP